MLVVHYNGSSCVLRPVPLISITQNVIRNKTGMLGSYYDITLNGTILPNEGSPYYTTGGSTPINPIAPFIQNYIRPSYEDVGVGAAMASIVHKQNLIRELFKQDGQLCELLPAKVTSDVSIDGPGPEGAIIKFFPTVESISFEEGPYVTNGKYTVNLRAEVLLDSANKIISDGLVNSTHTPLSSDGSPFRANNGDRLLLTTALAQSGFIDDYSESWSIDVEEGKGTTKTNVPYVNGTGDVTSIRTYRLTRNISATGRTMYYDEGGIKRKEAWEQAKKYVYMSVLRDTTPNTSNDNSSGYEQFPEYSLGPYFGSGYLNIAKNLWGGYNHLRTESFDITAGSFTLTDVWLLSSGTAYENYDCSLSKSSDNGLHKVSIQGNIKGLSSAHAGHNQYGGSINTSQILNPVFTTATNTQYQNALYKWHQISNIGQYGPLCHLFKRAQSIVHVGLNHIPLSVSLGSNEFTGEITYNIEYDSRPSNIVTGTLSENISVSDTYPGDVFAVIPVIGRQTGPVLQYIGGRTEYQRNLNIELVMDKYYASGQGPLPVRIRQLNVLSKPSLNEPFRSQISSIIHAYSPIQEPGIRKYFASPPSESWDASSGRYSLQINWTYELNR
jgi:hypothetical protein